MAIVTAPSSEPLEAPPSTYGSALALVTTLFFMWGFLTCLNDILVPHLKAIFDLNYAEVMLIQLAFFSAYFFFSIPSGKVIDWIGYKKTMVAGLLTMGLGALLFIPAASAPSFALFLAALMVLATGITALQVAANPYVAVLGPPATASSRLNLTQAFNSLGTFLAPYFGGYLILTASPKTMDEIRQLSADALKLYRLHEAASVKLPYFGLSLALFLLGILIAAVKLPAIPGAVHHKGDIPAGMPTSLWKYRHLVLGAIAIFVYVGAEVSIGSFLVNYFNQPDIGNLLPQEGAKLVSFYWGGAMVGRFIGSAVLHGLKALHAAISLALAGLFLTASCLAGGHLAGGAHSNSALLLSVVSARLVQARPLLALITITLALLLITCLLKRGRVRLETGHLLALCAISTALLVTTSMLSTGHLAMWSIILVGFFNSIMFPSIFTLGIARLGPLTGDGSGMLVMAIVGGAIIPVLEGVLADHIGLHHAFILPVMCYLYIVYYALRGSRLRLAGSVNSTV